MHKPKIGAVISFFELRHYIFSKENAYLLLERYLPRIVNIHIHDVMCSEDHQKLGLGKLDIERIVSILQETLVPGI